MSDTPTNPTPLRREYGIGAIIPGTPFVVVRVLGRGGMGTVYEVEDTALEIRRVLKTLHFDLREREDLIRRMQREARALAKIKHKNVVQIISAGQTADDARLAFFVMEMLDGKDLRAVLTQAGRLNAESALDIFLELLDALQEAHNAGIVHRDVKPENVFLHRKGPGQTETKLLD